MYHSGNNMVDPRLLFEKAQLRPGMHVADLGCGRTGHIVFPAARLVGERGIVYAVDIMKDVLENVRKTAAIHNLLNIEPVWGDLERPHAVAIPAHSLDVIFCINALVQMHDRGTALEQVADLLKEKARVLIVDWIKKGLPFGPQDDHFVDFDLIREWAHDKGFVVQEEFPMGKFHYGMVLYRHE